MTTRDELQKHFAEWYQASNFVALLPILEYSYNEVITIINEACNIAEADKREVDTIIQTIITHTFTQETTSYWRERSILLLSQGVPTTTTITEALKHITEDKWLSQQARQQAAKLTTNRDNSFKVRLFRARQAVEAVFSTATQQVSLTPSFIPQDPIYNLIIALTISASTQTVSKAVWYMEPGEYQLMFHPQSDDVLFVIEKLERKAHERTTTEIVSTTIQRQALYTSFWRALRHLEAQGIASTYEQPRFPSRELGIFKGFIDSPK